MEARHAYRIYLHMAINCYTYLDSYLFTAKAILSTISSQTKILRVQFSGKLPVFCKLPTSFQCHDRVDPRNMQNLSTKYCHTAAVRGETNWQLRDTLHSYDGNCDRFSFQNAY